MTDREERPAERPDSADVEPATGEAATEPRTGGDYAPSVAQRLAFYQRAGGFVTPFLTAVFAFFVGGLVVLITTRKNPLRTYEAIFQGSGLNWFIPFTVDFERVSRFVYYPTNFDWHGWDTAAVAALNLQQTLLTTTALILTGLGVAFAFRCGLFNIGGQGQYIVGAIVAVWVGTNFAGLPPLAHVLLAIVLATLAGAVYGGIAGLLKATVGAHEVITTTMLNWIAYWVGTWLFGLQGPLQDPEQPSVPISSSIHESAQLPVFWGERLLQGLHVGLFVALAALVAFWIILNRTTLGYEVRAVGLNPEAARYGGINVSRNYFLAMAISGLFAGLAVSLDILGWQSLLWHSYVQVS